MVLLVLVACTPRTTPGRQAQAPAPQTDTVPVTFEVPAGFSRTEAYTILVPLHPVRNSQWVVPTGTRGLDAIAVTSYALDADVTHAPDNALVAAVESYARKVEAISATPPVPSTVAGHRAFRHSVEQPSSSGPLAYDATFVFAGQYVVQVLCQHREQPDLIRTGCAAVLDTLKLNFG
jgi:hypothetical protein